MFLVRNCELRREPRASSAALEPGGADEVGIRGMRSESDNARIERRRETLSNEDHKQTDSDGGKSGETGRGRG